MGRKAAQYCRTGASKRGANQGESGPMSGKSIDADEWLQIQLQQERPAQKPPLITRARIRELVENIRSAGDPEMRAFKDALRAAYELGDLAPEVVSELVSLKVLDTKFRHRPTAPQAIAARLHDAKNDFLERLEKNWKPFVYVLIRNDFLEARRQADVLWERLKAISGDEGEDVRREYKFLCWYASQLLYLYSDAWISRSKREEVPISLWRIIADGMANSLSLDDLKRTPTDKKPDAFAHAIAVVKDDPVISQKRLAKICAISPQTIRDWMPDLKKAGWKGPAPSAAKKPPPLARKRAYPSRRNWRNLEDERKAEMQEQIQRLRAGSAAGRAR
jgi:hypothetical protein